MDFVMIEKVMEFNPQPIDLCTIIFCVGTVLEVTSFLPPRNSQRIDANTDAIPVRLRL